jgi:hypothetical protein
MLSLVIRRAAITLWILAAVPASSQVSGPASTDSLGQATNGWGDRGSSFERWLTLFIRFFSFTPISCPISLHRASTKQCG